MKNPRETIAAIATPPGRGGVGIIRVSGPHAKAIGKRLLNKTLTHKKAQATEFLDENNDVIDYGIALYFQSPHSFSGEDVLEFHGHGGPVVLDTLLQEILKHDVRMARPGEFSEQAFLNNKMDLAQAEAVADLINASSKQAARSAVRSLKGEFSEKISDLIGRLIQLRTYVEAAIDFPEEDVDFLANKSINHDLDNLIKKLHTLQSVATQGCLLQEGINVVIAGAPNAGKSSLLNALSKESAAIVSDIPGTTRDVLKEKINLDGIPLHIIDTAGLRQSDNPIEQEGIRRAWQEIESADEVLFIVDVNTTPKSTPQQLWPDYFSRIKQPKPFILVCNKIDLNPALTPNVIEHDNNATVYLSAKQLQGIDLLKAHLKKIIGFHSNEEGLFIARRRHVNALEKALTSLLRGKQQLLLNRAGELLADDLRQAQQSLSEITGEFSSDDLLGEIFSSFCLGK
jgi:tRNA modification GTPase